VRKTRQRDLHPVVASDDHAYRPDSQPHLRQSGQGPLNVLHHLGELLFGELSLGAAGDLLSLPVDQLRDRVDGLMIIHGLVVDPAQQEQVLLRVNQLHRVLRVVPGTVRRLRPDVGNLCDHGQHPAIIEDQPLVAPGVRTPGGATEEDIDRPLLIFAATHGA
jgi:hypothetical protein